MTFALIVTILIITVSAYAPSKSSDGQATEGKARRGLMLPQFAAWNYGGRKRPSRVNTDASRETQKQAANQLYSRMLKTRFGVSPSLLTDVAPAPPLSPSYSGHHQTRSFRTGTYSAGGWQRKTDNEGSRSDGQFSGHERLSGYHWRTGNGQGLLAEPVDRKHSSTNDVDAVSDSEIPSSYTRSQGVMLRTHLKSLSKEATSRGGQMSPVTTKVRGMFRPGAMTSQGQGKARTSLPCRGHTATSSPGHVSTDCSDPVPSLTTTEFHLAEQGADSEPGADRKQDTAPEPRTEIEQTLDKEQSRDTEEKTQRKLNVSIEHGAGTKQRMETEQRTGRDQGMDTEQRTGREQGMDTEQRTDTEEKTAGRDESSDLEQTTNEEQTTSTASVSPDPSQLPSPADRLAPGQSQQIRDTPVQGDIPNAIQNTNPSAKLHLGPNAHYNESFKPRSDLNMTQISGTSHPLDPERTDSPSLDPKPTPPLALTSPSHLSSPNTTAVTTTTAEPGWGDVSLFQVEERSPRCSIPEVMVGSDELPWSCRTRWVWRFLGEHVYPSRLYEAVCEGPTCWYGHFNCTPITHTLHVLQFCRHGCYDLRVPYLLRRHWQWTNLSVTVGCQCIR